MSSTCFARAYWYGIIFSVTLAMGVSTASAQWVQTAGPKGVSSLVFRGNTLFAGTDTGAFQSTNAGSNWASVAIGRNVTNAYGFAGDDSSFYARAGMRSLYYSSDDGHNWRLVDTALESNWYPAGSPLFPRGNSLFANRGVGNSPSNASLYRSTDHGASWVSVLPGLLANTFAVQDSILLVACQDAVYSSRYYLYRSSDNGSHWDPVSSTFQYGGLALAVHDGWLFSGGFGIWRSSDHGASWLSAGEGYGTNEVSCFAEAPGILIVGSWGNGVHLSTDDGAHWIPVNEGLPLVVTSIAIHDSTLYAGTLHGVWRRPLSQLSTSVRTVSAAVPTSVTLLQNYPNPFNPRTGIRYQMSGVSDVKLVVYDLLGRPVATLVDEREQPGQYEVTFDGSGLASGVYFYQLRAGKLVQTRKLVLQK